MARNEVFKEGTYISLPVPEGTESGDPVRVGSIVGVAQTTRSTASQDTPDAPDFTYQGFNDEGYASVALNGAWAFTITGGDALAIGAQVYIGTEAPLVGTLPTGGKLFGHKLGMTKDGRTIVRVCQSPDPAA